MKRLQHIFWILTAFFLSSAAIVPKVQAACAIGGGGIDLRECFTLGNNDQPVTSIYTSPAVLINLVVRNLFILAGILLFFTFLYAGFQYISGGKKGAEQAQSTFTTALTGFIIMFSAYWVLQILRVMTGINSIFQF